MNQKVIEEALVKQYNRNREYCDQITNVSEISNSQNTPYVPFSQKEEEIKRNVIKFGDEESENILKTQDAIINSKDKK